MSKLIFSPEDFADYINECDLKALTKWCNTKFDSWLEQQPVVYSYKNQIGNFAAWARETQGEDTHTARLVCIEELPKSPCSHQPEYSNKIPGWHHGPESEVECRICGVKLVAKWEAV